MCIRDSCKHCTGDHKRRPKGMIRSCHQKSSISKINYFNYNRLYEAMQSDGRGRVSGNKKDVYKRQIPENDFFIGVQFHPEFKSRPNKAHPLFREFIAAAMK